MNKIATAFRLNGTEQTVEVESRRLLSDMLREDCLLTGTHVGCEHGVCGACTVLIDGKPARSCLMFAVQAEGRAITTVESLSVHGKLHAIQQALHDHHGLQCGFCTPGILMTFVAYLDEYPDPNESEIREVLSGHLCRCTGYHNIVVALMAAARVMREEKQ